MYAGANVRKKVINKLFFTGKDLNKYSVYFPPHKFVSGIEKNYYFRGSF